MVLIYQLLSIASVLDRLLLLLLVLLLVGWFRSGGDRLMMYLVLIFSMIQEFILFNRRGCL